MKTGGGKLIDCHKAPACPESRPIAVVFRVVDQFPLQVYMFSDLLQSVFIILCNDPTIGSYNHYHLSPNGIPSGIQRWYGLVYIIHMAGNLRIRPRE